MSKRMPELIVGGEPRVDLLPPEIRAARRGAAARRAMTMVLVGLIAAVGVGISGTALLAGAAGARLAAEQAITTDLLMQQQQFIEVRQNTQQIGLIEAATRVGTSTLVDWEAFLGSLSSSFPAGSAVQTFTIQSATPVLGLAQSALPLAHARIATVLIGVQSPTLVDTQTWIARLGAVPGVVEVVVSTVQSNPAGFITTLSVSVDGSVLVSATGEGK